MSSNLKNLEKLIIYMNEHRVQREDNDEDDYNYQSWGKLVQGRFKIDDCETFLDLYKNAIEEGADLSILERPTEYGPIVIDIDLKYAVADYDSAPTRLYTSDDLNKILNAYNKALGELVELTDIKYNFYIFEKPKPKTLDDIYKDGFHIMIPEIIVNTEIKHMVRRKVIELLTDIKLFDNSLTSLDKIVDKAVIQANGWFLYYSKKPGDKHPYKLTHIFNKK